MLIVHQTGSVKVAEVVRYTLTYTPSLDRILPPPTHLHVKIKNTSAVPLRAAYLHGPYTLYVACYPSTFNAYEKQENGGQEGEPEFEPQLKAGGHWLAKLTVPEEVRQDAERSFFRSEEAQRKSFTWVIEVASQILFSTSAAVHFEVLVGRDEKSIHLGFHGVVGSGQGAPGRLEDHQQGRSRTAAQPKGVFSKAVKLVVEDTETLWNTPSFASFEDQGTINAPEQSQNLKTGGPDRGNNKPKRKPQKVHLVLLTHGLHSNLGADMLFMKESIDAAAKQARKDAKARRAELKAKKIIEENDFARETTGKKTKTMPQISVTPTPSEAGDDPSADHEDDDYDPDDEEIIVRGFNKNAVKTEKGIQYLGKRLAKYVLSITYPDQPYLPVKSSISRTITRSLTGQKLTDSDAKKPIHKGSSIVKDEEHTNHNLPYKITSISFIGHSLGGLIQTYAIAYIQKHSPEFFDRIKPVNFVAMASPFLGLSNENPMYVKFALDFGLVGRTGQDLGLTWRAPAVVKSSWGAMISGFQADASKDQKDPDPGSKPLLRILPTGPAHIALKRFMNRTVYSNVVNDGIVPLRTSCLLFLDWRGLGRVEKARRENGLVGTMVGWGWAEMTGQNASAIRKPLAWNDLFGDSDSEAPVVGKKSPDPASSVPQAEASQEFDYDAKSETQPQSLSDHAIPDEVYGEHKSSEKHENTGLWSGFMSLFKPQAGSKSPKMQKIYRRGQAKLANATSDDEGRPRTASLEDSEDHHKPGLVRGSSLYTNTSENGGIEAPPKTTFFESAGDLLNPPLPSKEFLLDPAARPRTIFHDRVYHPNDIPPPPVKRQRTFMRRASAQGDDVPNQAHSDISKISSHPPIPTEEGTMKIEERIARAYHKDMAWRKVLVRLEPDAHNNMIVRRMFANAYGWPVVKHLCDTHFAYTAAARTADDEEAPEERARPAEMEVGSEGEQVKGQVKQPHEARSDNKAKSSDRAMTMDDVDQMPDDPDAVKKDLEQLRSKVQSPTNKTSRDVRSPSEIRESRDEVSDLVSMVSATGQTSGSTYGGLISSKTILNSLARRDSARWSDRFFDSDGEDEDDEEDNEAFLKELQRARERGEHITEEEIQHEKRISASPKMSRIQPRSNTSLRSAVSNATTESRDQQLLPPKKMLSDPTRPVVAEPTQMSKEELDAVAARAAQDSLSSASDTQAPRGNSDESHEAIGQDLEQTRSLTEVGLGKTVEDHVVHDTSKDDKKGTAGVAERVAIAQGKNT